MGRTGQPLRQLGDRKEQTTGDQDSGRADRSTGSGRTASVVSAVSGSAANWGTITIKISRYGYDTTWTLERTLPDRNIDASASALRLRLDRARENLFRTCDSKTFLFQYPFRRRGAAPGSFRHEGGRCEDVFSIWEKRFGQRHGVTLHAGYDVYKGSGELDGYRG